MNRDHDLHTAFPADLLSRPLPAPWGGEGAFFALSDGAVLWHTEIGSGKPLVLLHGWRGSSRFWARNVPALAREFRVIVPDLRGHGSSTKTMEGHTIPRYAQDLHELLQSLGAERPVLVGWSMSGSLAMEYWRQFGETAVSGIALVDSSLAPFADGDWNAFRLKRGKSDAHNENMRAMRNNTEVFTRQFAAGMFGEVKATEEELDWMTDEIAKTPPWIGTAIHSDYVVRDYERLLPSVTVPAAVFSGAFGPGGLEMGKHFADRFPAGRYYPYPHCGHMPFYEDATAFNAQLAEFCKSTF